MHACALCEEIGVSTVLVPRAGGVLSALGLAIADARRDYATPVLAALADTGTNQLRDAFEEMRRRADADLGPAELVPGADLRYRGQSYELTVDAADLDGLEERFHALHEERYGYRADDEPVEVVTLRLTATVAGDEPPVLKEEPSGGGPEPRMRPARFTGEWVDTPVWDRSAMSASTEIPGPAIIEFPESMCVVGPGWEARVDASGTIVLEWT